MTYLMGRIFGCTFPDAAAGRPLGSPSPRTPPATLESPRPDGKSSYLLSELLLTFALLLVLALALQYKNGAFESDLAGYPDEAAHYVTGLMIRDYIASGFAQAPMEFATGYYSQYPKVAFGHWPPVFYLVEALWMLLFSHSRVAVLVLMAVITAVLATAVSMVVRGSFGRAMGIVSGVAVVALPAVQSQTMMVMPEVLLSLFGFSAALFLARYLENEKAADALWFGFFASLSILTKGNGWAVPLVAPLAFLLGGKLRLLRSPGFITSAIFVALVCVPWQIFSARFIRHVWSAEPGSLPAIFSNSLEVLEQSSELVSFPVFVLAIIGAVASHFFAQQRVLPFGQWASFLSLALAVSALNAIVPLEVERRKLLIALPPLVIFAVAGYTFLAARLSHLGAPAWTLSATLATAVLLTGTFTMERKHSHGFVSAAEATVTDQPFFTQLVSGSASGEGAFIAEVAMRDRARQTCALRASKVLAQMDWGGRDYRLLFNNTEEIRAFLNRSSVSAIILEDMPGHEAPPHHALLVSMLNEDPREWEPLVNQALVGPGVRVRVFRRVNAVVQKTACPGTPLSTEASE